VPDVESRIIDELLMSGEYDRLAARARDKERTLELIGLQNPSPSDVRVSWDDLCRWYFEERLGQPIPHDVPRYARECGFEDEMCLRRAVLREYCYVANQTVAAPSVAAPSSSQWRRQA
jgi:hypothetical protein